MNRNPSNTQQITVQRRPKREYKAPVLRLFGSVTELTAATAGSCNNDGVAPCKEGGSTMVMGA